jgi:hypothetical protein
MTMPQHLQFALELLPHINQDNTAYTHVDPPQVYWGDGEPPWQSYADCSNFLNALIGKTYSWATEAVLNAWFEVPTAKRGPNLKRPLAIDYYNSIRDERAAPEKDIGFSIIGDFSVVAPGDIIAINYGGHSDSDDDTGHVMLVEAVSLAGVDQQATAIADTTQWIVHIIDQAAQAHGPGDTRVLPSGNYYPGLGSGFIRLYVYQDEEAHPPDAIVAAYAWVGEHLKPDFIRRSERPVVIGRLQSVP